MKRSAVERIGRLPGLPDAELHAQCFVSAVADLVADVDTTIEDTRRIAHDLSPAFLEGHGLVAAMESHLDRAASEHGPAISLDVPLDRGGRAGVV